MTEKREKKVRSTGKGKAERASARQKGRNVRGAEVKKISAKWFSLDSIMGKVLCILLVIILTVGAFLAPKLIGSLYDAGTLMQITYVDMELSPYAVVYASFEDKLMAIARADTAGDHLMTLSAEETDKKISDAELVEAVNREMKQVSEGLSILFFEGWWEELTEENLVSREKNTIYMQSQSGTEGSSLQETAPIQFWTLTFELTEEQIEEQIKAGFMEEYDKLSEAEKKTFVRENASRYTTDRLIVCMDTDFYKIYAVAVEGEGSRIVGMYGWELPEIFGMPLQTGVVEGNRYMIEQDYLELRMYLTDQTVEYWADYWNVMPEDKSVYLNIGGEMSGCMVFREEAETEAGAGDTSESTDFADTATDMEYGGNAAAAGSEIVVENGEVVMWGGDSVEEGEILLDVGCQGGFSGQDSTLWVQKTGCRNFFEMMQF